MRSLPRISPGTDTAPGSAPAAPARMDRALPRSRWTRWRWPAAAALLVAGLSVLVARTPAPGSTQSVSADRVTVGAVVRGQFVDDLPVRATVLPLTSVYLDAVEGGRVERVLVEDGARVTAGALLAE
ncbi:MAG: hypothetical protein ACK537_10085, partial [Pseudomonadota bacterium]